MDIGKLYKCVFSIDLNFKILPSLMNYNLENVQIKDDFLG